MYLNTLKPGPGSRQAAKRVGRGIGSTLGKTCGRGHKGQKARAGGFHKVGFEGGQMPLQRRLPKIGFKSRGKRFVAEVNLRALNAVPEDTIDIVALKNAKLIPSRALRVKVIAKGDVERPIVLKGLQVTSGARGKIEQVGGKIEA